VNWARELIQGEISLARELISARESCSGRRVPSRWGARSPAAAAWLLERAVGSSRGLRLGVGRVGFSCFGDQIKA